MKWLADPANQDKVVNILTGISKIIKFIFRLTEFGVTNTIDGLYDLLREDATCEHEKRVIVYAYKNKNKAFS